MTFLEDKCDFCGKYYDAMGCDTKEMMMEPLIWDGQCTEGLKAKYGQFTIEQLRTVVIYADKRLEPYEPISEWRSKTEAEYDSLSRDARNALNDTWIMLLNTQGRRHNANKMIELSE